MIRRKDWEKPEEEVRFLEGQELEAFFYAVTALGDIRDRALFRLMYHFGLRVQEAVDLRMSDFREKGKALLIHRVMGGISLTYALPPKHEKSLRAWKAERIRMRNAAGNPFLFITSRCGKGPMQRNTIQKAFARYADAAGLPEDKRHVHILRHSVAVHLVMRGADIYELKNRLGYSKISSTEIYLAYGGADFKRQQARVSASLDY